MTEHPEATGRDAAGVLPDVVELGATERGEAREPSVTAASVAVRLGPG